MSPAIPIEGSNTSCFNTTILEQYYTLTAAMTIGACLLSIVGSILIIFSYLIWKDVRKSTARAIVLCLAICDLMSASGYIIAPVVFYKYYNSTQSGIRTRKPIPTTWCVFQSFWTTFFVLSSFFWTSYLSLYFVVTLVFQKTQWSKKLMWFFVFTAWPVPLVIIVIALSTGWLGPSRYSTVGAWCWVSDKHLNNYNQSADYNFQYIARVYFVMEAITGKFWEILTYFIVFGSTITVVASNRCIRQKELSKVVKPGSYTSELITGAISMRKIELRLVAIPVILILFRIVGTARYIMAQLPNCHAASIDEHDKTVGLCITDECDYIFNPVLMSLQAIGDPLQGFGNAVLFVFMSKAILIRYMLMAKKVFRMVCCCKCFRKEFAPGADEDNISVQYEVDNEEKRPLIITYTTGRRDSVKQTRNINIEHRIKE